MVTALHSNSAVMEGVSVLLAASLIWVSAIVQHATNVIKRGTRYVMSDRSIAPDMDGFFGRASRTLSNNIESALMYIPPMMILIILGRTNLVTQTVAALYIGARCTFSVAYWGKLSSIRSLAWLTGILCCTIAITGAALALTSR